MARLARTVVAGYPHHITQRGNRRLPTFFSDEDYEAYLALLAEHCGACGVKVLAWCLMPNHVHLVAVPKTEDALARGLGEAHRRYTRRINFREGWRGHLWQERFFSCVLDRPHAREFAVKVLHVGQALTQASLADPPHAGQPDNGLLPPGLLDQVQPESSLDHRQAL